MAGLDCCTDCSGELTINSISMHTYAWCCTDLFDLWLPPPTRGDNIIIDERPGQRPYWKQIDQSNHSLPMIISGLTDQYGVPAADFNAQLLTNFDYLVNNVILPPTAPTATVSAQLVLPGAVTRTAEIQVVGFNKVAAVNYTFIGTLEITIPEGYFT